VGAVEFEVEVGDVQWSRVTTNAEHLIISEVTVSNNSSLMGRYSMSRLCRENGKDQIGVDAYERK